MYFNNDSNQEIISDTPLYQMNSLMIPCRFNMLNFYIHMRFKVFTEKFTT